MQVPAQIKRTVGKIVQVVAGLQIKLAICVPAYIANVGIEATNVVADVTICTLDKGVAQTNKYL